MVIIQLYFFDSNEVSRSDLNETNARAFDSIHQIWDHDVNLLHL